MLIYSILQDIATQNMHDHEFELSRSLKVKVYGGIRKPTYDFLFVNNSKYMPICRILWDIVTQNMHDLEFHLSMSLKVKVNGAIRKPTYDFLLVNTCNGKYMPIFSILWDIATQNMHDFEFDLSRSLKVDVISAIRKPTYDFLSVNNYNYMLICIGSWVISVWNFPPPMRPHYMKHFKVL